MQYIILKTYDKQSLSEEVTNKLSDGWVLSGNLIILGNEFGQPRTYIQAMQKITEQ